MVTIKVNIFSNRGQFQNFNSILYGLKFRQLYIITNKHMVVMTKVDHTRKADGKFIKNDELYRKNTMALTDEEQDIILKIRARKARKGVVGSIRRVIHV